MNTDCTVYRTVEYLSRKWSLLILLELFKGEGYSKRYSELKRDLIDITPKVLSARLKELQSEGLVSKVMDASAFPVRSDYALTESGLALIDVVKNLKEWALTWKIDNEPCRKMDCIDCPL